MQNAIRIGEEGEVMRAAACTQFDWFGKDGSKRPLDQAQFANRLSTGTMRP